MWETKLAHIGSKGDTPVIIVVLHIGWITRGEDECNGRYTGDYSVLFILYEIFVFEMSLLYTNDALQLESLQRIIKIHCPPKRLVSYINKRIRKTTMKKM
jgi:hypothetical protein